MPPTPQEGTESSTGGRRLHVIVISDVVNSTACMFLDEASTVAQIEADLQGFDLLIEQQGGRLIKHSGDGILATCATTSAALTFIEAAVLHLHRRGGSPLQHRFGMHLCESYQTGTDVLGKGVNLASRLALRMGTTRSAISRLEGSNKHLPVLSTLRRYADVLGCDVEVQLVPRPPSVRFSREHLQCRAEALGYTAHQGVGAARDCWAPPCSLPMPVQLVPPAGTVP